MSNTLPKVTVIIPHFNGEEILRHCLEALRKTAFNGFKILVVDNGSTDDSVAMVRSEFPDVRLVESIKNLGFAGGCNLGIRECSAEYIVLLNDDTEVTPDWLNPLVRIADAAPDVGAVQPKMLSYFDRDRFDYCGAAGGEMDVFGYPFARGRLFQTLELDEGQYDSSETIFWATGAACLLRLSALDEVGLLDESFFAHMEEIDLNWRLQWAGYRIVAAPESVVYHQTGATLGTNTLKKMFLNHRNNLMMLFKNVSACRLLWLFPLRLLLEGMTILVSIFKEPKRAAAAILGALGVIPRLGAVIRGRRRIKQTRRVSESVLIKRMYPHSAALAYFLRGIRKTSDLPNYRTS